MIEVLDPRPDCDVQDAEYHRLLGYPRDHALGERALELATWARGWFAEHGRPWIYLREVDLQLTPDALCLDGTSFASRSELLDATLVQRSRCCAAILNENFSKFTSTRHSRSEDAFNDVPL